VIHQRRGRAFRGARFALALVLLAVGFHAPPLAAQTFSQRGFLDVRGVMFPQRASNDDGRLVGDVLAREEAFLKPVPWVQFAAGLDVRANSYDQVEDRWRIDIRDRRIERPRLSVRRLGATFTRGPLTVDIGKQFIRWGKADIVTPTDRFAPRDFLTVVDNDFLAVSGVRAVAQWQSQTFEIVWVPWFTPSRTPLLDQRWTVVPPSDPPLRLVDAIKPLPQGSQAGVRLGHMGDRYEASISYFNGFNHLPNIQSTPGSAPFDVFVMRTYPTLRSYGLDAAVPTPWFTVKGEVAYATTSTPATDEYVLYVVQVERQTGEWFLVGGYAGEAVTARRAQVTFAPDRGLTRSLLGRASYTFDANRSVAFEAAVRQTGRGAYVKGELSQARGSHWRATLAGVLVRGRADDFLGQFRLNSHVNVALRYSF
jgi:hypothetical protein